MSLKNKLKVAIIGATGYTGLDLTYILSKHPNVKIIYLCASKNLGKKITFFDKRIKKELPNISSIDKIDWSILDLIFYHYLMEKHKILLKKLIINLIT